MQTRIHPGFVVLAFALGVIATKLLLPIFAFANITASGPQLNCNIEATAVNNYGSTSTTFPVSVATGTKRTLFVYGAAENGNNDTSATYNGTAMTHATSSVGNEAYYDVWYLSNPPAGTHDAVVNFASSSRRQYAAVVLNGVDQMTPIDAITHYAGTGVTNPSVSVTTNVANDAVFYFMADDISNITYTPNDTRLFYVDNEPSNNSALIGAATTVATATTTTVGGTGADPHWSGPGPWELVAVPIRPAN